MQRYIRSHREDVSFSVKSDIYALWKYSSPAQATRGGVGDLVAILAYALKHKVELSVHLCNSGPQE